MSSISLHSFLLLISCFFCLSYCNPKNTDVNVSDSDSLPNTLVISLENLKIIIKDMMFAPSLDHDSIAKLDTVSFDLGYGLIYGEIKNKLIYVLNNAIDSFMIFEKYCINLFFSDEGSGGVDCLHDTEQLCTDWSELFINDKIKCKTSAMPVNDTIFPDYKNHFLNLLININNGFTEKIEKNYNINISTVYLKIVFLNKTKHINEKLIKFTIHYGD